MAGCLWAWRLACGDTQYFGPELSGTTGKAMKLDGKYKLNASRPELWKALNDPEVLRSCTPGCKQMVANGDDAFDVVIEIGIASVKGRYTGHIAIRDRIPNEQYRLEVSGSGTAGFMNASGLIQLSEAGDATAVEYAVEAHVGGLAAGLGQRVMEGAAKLLVGQFFSCLETTLRSQRAARSGADSASST